MRPGTPPRVLLVCSGLDHARRGFESFARECFDALRDDPGLELHLIKGSGAPADRERSVRTITRDSPVARALGRTFDFRSFLVEQVSFALSLQPELLRSDPDVVYFSEWYTGLALAKLRRATGRRYSLVLCNGTMAADHFEHLDHVQQLTPTALEIVLARGADPSRQSVLPLGFAISPQLSAIGRDECEALRTRLRLPVDRQVLLSTAALNRHHKRIDYVIEEVARLPRPRPYLLLAGEPDAETPGIRELARARLGDEGHDIRTVAQEEVGSLYCASDLFILASLGEAQGRSFVEAMANGLPCLAHDYPIARFALGDHGRYADLSKPGGLAQLLVEARDLEPDSADARARHRFVYDRFSWDRLRPRYVKLLTASAKSTVSSSTGENVSRKNR